ncbi:prolipoprotein diacylglyceryl transferase [Sporolactobacillus nakayamae]|uniref:Phosphatidylglycerol--prolipoprotein diacylglyceryl transferase n=1 Tax=Sporolactobacillus nakayamae TaxID=269670 RepID=A0A1I2T2L5_9BACL|nr:prolipoprotein diacylglyceryl transferase [Sporolactobacillus nakayamae]SFG59304.1 phosphatidylglycerol:prolipoprotein diacylglycerol transferase [Sporolactobacillus nakayamae]
MWFPGPVLFRIGPIPINTLGASVALATLFGLWLINREAKRQGIQADYMVEFAIYCVLGGVLGARLWFVLFKWPYYAAHPAEIFMVWMGGLAIQGGILGGTLVGIWLAKKHKLPVWQVADIVAPALILGMAIGRISDFLTGDAYGIPSDSILAVSYPPGTFVYNIFGSTPVLPMPLFEAIGDLIIFGFLLLIKYRKPFQGFLFLQMLALYSTLRFTLEFWRGDSLRTLLNLKVAQLTALATIILAIGFMIGRYRQMKAAHRE